MGKSVFTFNYNCSKEELVSIINQWLEANDFMLDNTDGYNWYHAHNALTYGHRGFEYRIIDDHTFEISAFINTIKNPHDLTGFVGSVPKNMYSNLIQQLVGAIPQTAQPIGQQQFTGNNQAQMNQMQPQNGYNNQMNQMQQQNNYNSNGQMQMNNNQVKGQNNYNNNQIMQGQMMNQHQQYNNQMNNPNYNQTYNQGYNQGYNNGYNQNYENYAQTTNNQFLSAVEDKNSKLAIVAFVLSIFELLCAFLGVGFGAILVIIGYAIAAQGLNSRNRKLSIAAIIISSISLLIIVFEIIIAIL